MNSLINSLVNDDNLPLVMNLGSISPNDFISFYKDNYPEIEKSLRKQGAIKFRGVEIGDINDFQYITGAISSSFLQYIDGNSPRTKLSETIYTSTEYDQTQKITLHNELSYSKKWPNKLFFTCLQPAKAGGETLLADSRKILESMPLNIINAIEQKGLIYIRNLHGGMGMGPSWQETFETDSKEAFEQYCSQYKIEFEWGADNAVALKQRSQGIITHRESGEKIWFNQIDQFHPSHLGEEYYEVLQTLYGNPENYPMYVTFGNGEEIPASMIREILETIEKVTVYPSWDKNELLIVDNELIAHGRNAFSGERKVLVTMCA